MIYIKIINFYKCIKKLKFAKKKQYKFLTLKITIMRQFLFFIGLAAIVVLFVLALVTENAVDSKLFSALCLVIGSVTVGQLNTSSKL